MHKIEESLFTQYEKKDEREDFLENEVFSEKTRDIENILSFLGYQNSLKEKDFKFCINLLSAVFESLDKGNLAYFNNDKNLQKPIENLCKLGIAKLWKENSPKDLSETEKLCAIVESENGWFFYLQKQWNTYVRLVASMKKRNHEKKCTSKKKSPAVLFKELNLDQQRAIEGICDSSFSLLLGGPGTGKTTVASFIIEEVYNRNPEIHIALLTPTGRAGARLGESLKGQWEKRSQKELLTLLEKEWTPKTIERFLLEFPKDDLSKLLGNEVYPNLDFVLIDEISMVSPSLFAELLEILPPSTQIVLLGDVHQLPPISEGFLLDFFLHEKSPFPIFHLQTLVRAENKDLKDLILYLQNQFQGSLKNNYSPNFLNLSFIQTVTLQDFLTEKQEREGVFFVETNEKENSQAIEEILKVYARKYKVLEKDEQEYYHNPHSLLQIFYKNQLLSPIKHGIMGVDYINTYCQHYLSSLSKELVWKPIMVEKNQSLLGLFNGDLGLSYTKGQKSLVYFGDKERCYYERSQVSHCGDSFAMTVHKVQGSEFEEIFLFLPKEALEQILSREIFYTAISRAKKRVVIFSSRFVLEKIFHYHNKRQNGLSLFL